MKRILVAGADGLIGQNICRAAAQQEKDVIGTYKNTSWARYCPMGAMDPANADEVREVMNRYRPDAVFIDTSSEGPEYCESHPQEAWASNVDSVLNIASAAEKTSSRVFLLSTDMVFSGEKGSRYTEEDQTDPQSRYAQMKLESERIVLDASKHNCVCRVSAVYGYNKATPKYNFITWALDQMMSGRKTRLLGDRRVTPSYAPDCAEKLILMAEKYSSGIYHMAAPDSLSRYEMGVKMAEIFGLDTELCVKISSSDISETMLRGRDTSLDSSKAEKELNQKFMSFEETIRDMKESYVDRKKQASIESERKLPPDLIRLG